MPRKPKKVDVTTAVATLITALVDERREAYNSLYCLISEIESWKRTVKKARAAVEEAKIAAEKPETATAKTKTKAKKTDDKPVDNPVEKTAAPAQGDNLKLIKAEADLQNAYDEVQTREQKVQTAKDRYERLNDILHRVYDIDRDYTDSETFRHIFN